MELSEFVRATLTQISKGMHDANRDLRTEGAGALVNPQRLHRTREGVLVLPELGSSYMPPEVIHEVAFDVAVHVESASKIEGGGGINVAGLLKAGGDANSSESNARLSRITFKVPMIYPR